MSCLSGVAELILELEVVVAYHRDGIRDGVPGPARGPGRGYYADWRAYLACWPHQAELGGGEWTVLRDTVSCLLCGESCRPIQPPLRRCPNQPHLSLTPGLGWIIRRPRAHQSSRPALAGISDFQ